MNRPSHFHPAPARSILLPLLTLLLCAPSGLSAADAAQSAGPLAPYSNWRHSGSLFILTTPDGANLPASSSEADFPLLVRLHRDFFNFSQAKAHGEDIRFSTPAGVPLPYQIEQWDAANGTASIWVRIPAIKGNARQEIRIHWGNVDAPSASSGKAVFNNSNGCLSVWHMSDPVTDEVGTLPSKDVGTTASAGMIGAARHFSGHQGIFCGDRISSYPAGAASHTTEAWFRAEKPNSTIIGWGNEGGGRGTKVRMQLRSPPHLHIDSDFADVNGNSTLPMSRWIHVAHTYSRGQGRIYIDGRLDGSAAPLLAIKSPARLWIGGWYHNYDFVGDIDEVRISSIARSADWVRLEYENQKPLQTLVGPVVQPGSAFAVSPAQITVPEGKSVTLSAQAGGAQKIYWILKRDGRETVVAADRFSYTFAAGRVTGDQSLILQFKAIYPNEVKTRDIPITITENIPDPAFALQAPATWDGRRTIEVIPQIANLRDLQAKGAGDLNYNWTISGIATLSEMAPGKLILKRSQNSGPMTVSLTLSNGGSEVRQQITIAVTEPKTDPWVQRTPDQDEQPQDNQFYARDDHNEGTLHCNGTLDKPADAVFLKVYADDQLYKQENAKLPPDRRYAFSVKLKPGLIRYRTEFGSITGGRETVLRTATNLVCGDAYLIDGQSNAEATDIGKDDLPYTNPWIRTYGSPAGDPGNARLKLWGNAICRNRNGGRLQIGYWALQLGKRLVEEQKIPVCIINGAVGGSRIDQHQRNPDNPEDVATIYGRMLWRVRQAKLTHGIRAILWHQGENDQGADGPTGRYGWETYQQYFVDMSAGWKRDYPNLQHYYIFQIWPNACAMGGNGSGDMLREVQRTLPRLYAHMSIMSTLGIRPPGGCHYPLAGWAEFARLICPLMERDIYGRVFTTSITPPDLKRASFTSDRKDAVALEFDQPVNWNDALVSQFYLDGARGKVASGRVTGNTITLKLTAATEATKITYLNCRSWSQDNILYGANGIAALTFCNVPILPPGPMP